jgi:hypothetical protein
MTLAHSRAACEQLDRKTRWPLYAMNFFCRTALFTSMVIHSARARKHRCKERRK